MISKAEETLPSITIPVLIIPFKLSSLSRRISAPVFTYVILNVALAISLTTLWPTFIFLCFDIKFIKTFFLPKCSINCLKSFWKITIKAIAAIP